jgi:protein-arginine kinase activator protein McsA
MRALTEGDELDFDLDITEEDLEEVLTPEEILKKLDEALLNEDYELASKLRDELDKRNNK